jgi:hypothetical protein
MHVFLVQVEFEAIRGSSYFADIALDDIDFQEMPCGEPCRFAIGRRAS